MATEPTVILIKPDGVARGLIGEVFRPIARQRLTISKMEQRTLEREVAEEHYGEHRERPFFGELVEFITSGPAFMIAVVGEGAIAALRTMMGPTNPLEAQPGTIRGDFALEVGQNVIHGSDSPESGARELALHFPELG